MVLSIILQIMRDPDTGNSKGYAFINFASFDASDAAIEAMNGQYLCNRPITISYAFKKESKGERHGSAAGWCYTCLSQNSYMCKSIDLYITLYTCNYYYNYKLLLCLFCHEMTFKSTLDLRVKCLDRMKSIAGYLRQL